MLTATGSSMEDSVALSIVRTERDSSKNPVAAVVVQCVSGTCNLRASQVYTMLTKSKQCRVLIIIIIPIYIYYCRRSPVRYILKL